MERNVKYSALLILLLPLPLMLFDEIKVYAGERCYPY